MLTQINKHGFSENLRGFIGDKVVSYNGWNDGHGFFCCQCCSRGEVLAIAPPYEGDTVLLARGGAGAGQCATSSAVAARLKRASTKTNKNR